jgi:hypothetical protein
MIKLNLINPEEIYQSISKGNPFNRIKGDLLTIMLQDPLFDNDDQ